MKKIFFSIIVVSQLCLSQVNGTIDTSFNYGTGFSNQVNCIVEQPDGKILVGGSLGIYNAQTVYFGLIRLNADGSKDLTFSINIDPASTETVNQIILQPDGKIIVVGPTQKHILRLNPNGSIDTTFLIGTGFNQTANAVALQPNGKILVGGDFSTFDGISAKKIVRLNTDGTLDNSFVNSATNAGIDKIVLQTDGKILIGGGFGFNLQNIDVGDLMRLNSDGSVDTTFNSENGLGLNNPPLSILLEPNGKILLAGGFTQYNNTNVGKVFRLDSDGTIDSSFQVLGTGISSTVQSIHRLNNGQILAGGSFYYYNGEIVNGIVLLNNNGSRDYSLDSGTGFFGEVKTIALQADQKLIMGGTFSSYNNVTANKIIRLVGASLMTNNYSLQKIDLYPNPATNRIYLTGLNGLIHYQLYSMAGQKIIDKVGFEKSIEVSNLPSGIYQIIIYEDDRVYIRKFVKEM